VVGEEMMQFTSAIPTYNGASGYLSKVLDALLKQKTTIRWELIMSKICHLFANPCSFYIKIK
jgi:hypothetical protein